MSSQNNGWLTVGRFNTQEAAAIAAGMLSAQGLHPMVSPSNMNTLFGGSIGWAPVEISVPAHEADQAVTLLKQADDL